MVNIETILSSNLPRGESGYSGYSGAVGATGLSGYSGYSGFSGYSGLPGPSTTINATDDVLSASLYPVMVNAAGTNQTAKTTSTKLYFDATVGTLNSTSFNSLSDVNLKKDVSIITDAVPTLRKIDGVSFTWKDNNKKSYGVIAQEIEQILPEVVETNINGVKSVNYAALTGFFIEAIKELHAEIEALKSNK